MQHNDVADVGAYFVFHVFFLKILNSQGLVYHDKKLRAVKLGIFDLLNFFDQFQSALGTPDFKRMFTLNVKCGGG